MTADLIGSLVAILTTASFIPQTIKTIRTRDLSGISFLMYAMFALGVALWLAYGLMIGKAPVIAANLVTLALASTILYMKGRSLLAARMPKG